MESYLVPAGFGETEYIEKKSRFLGRVWPVETETEALAHIGDMRKLHHDATHNVYAYILRDGTMRFSDDGEPGGTSGMPTLSVFRSAEIFNVCCVITRYFGGILLGSGGLVRAYSTTAAQALKAAGIARMGLWRLMEIDCGYSIYELVKRELAALGAAADSVSFAQSVTITAAIPDGEEETVRQRLASLSAGKIVCRPLGTGTRAVALE